MTTYVCKFARIGRSSKGSFETTFDAIDADDLAAQVWKYARSKLASSMYEVTVDLEAMTGSIEYGRFGTFTIGAVSA